MRPSLLIFCSWVLSLSITVIGGCSQQETEPTTTLTQTPQPTTPNYLPRKTLFQAPVQYQGRISPNGAKVSWLSYVDGALNLFIADSNAPDSARQYTFGDRGVEVHEWSSNSAYVLYTKKAGELHTLKTYSLNVYSGQTIALGDTEETVAVKLQKLSRNWPDTALVSITRPDQNYGDLYRINLRNGKSKPVHKNQNFIRWVADDDLVARIGIGQNPNKSQDWFLLLPDGTKQTLFHVKASQTNGTRPLRFDPSGTILYMLDQRGRQHSVFAKLDLAEGKIDVVGQVPGHSVQNVLFHPVTGRAMAWRFNADLPHWVAMEERFQTSLDLVKAELGPNFHILATTSDMQQLVLYSDRPDRPGKYSLLNRGQETITTMFETAPKSIIPEYSRTKLVQIPARDGFTLIGYLSPANRPNGVQSGPPPLIILPQPWPGSRMVYAYDPQIPWLNSRGYSVLELNTRGTGHLGIKYDKQMHGVYLKKSPKDLMDAAKWAVENGWADRNLISAIGTGFGGLNVLLAVSNPHNPFKCAVTLDAVIDVSETFKWLNQNNPHSAARLAKVLVDHRSNLDWSLMQKLSPRNQSAKISVPVLLLQSDRLPGVSVSTTTEYATALAGQQSQVTLAVLKGEFDVWYENKVVPPALAISEQFFAQCLGGIAEPFGADLDGLDIQLPVGAEHIFGLREALGENCCPVLSPTKQ